DTPSLPRPAACRTYRTKCAGVSDEAKAFADQYCELISPCCDAAGLGADCRLNVESAARRGTYDASAGEVCLADMRRRSAKTAFWASLGTGGLTWDVISQCAGVFGSGTPDSGPPDPNQAVWSLPTTFTPGDECVGTLIETFEATGPSRWVFGNDG